MEIIRLLILTFILCFQPMHIFAQEKTITLVVSGEASTKEEATKQALRSAIEQAFGTFVSANTTIINDEITKDEIVSITSGNISEFKEISSNKENNIYNVTLKATVSINKLTSYAQNKGITTELAGSTFLINHKIRELNKINELTAIANLDLYLMKYVRGFNLFDNTISIGDPFLTSNKYGVNAVVTSKPNSNFYTYCNIIKNQLEEISLKDSELEEYKKSNTPFYSINIPLITSYKANNDPQFGIYTFYFRNNYDFYCFPNFSFMESTLQYKITDNIGNKFYFFFSDSYDVWNEDIAQYIGELNPIIDYSTLKRKKYYFFYNNREKSIFNNSSSINYGITFDDASEMFNKKNNSNIRWNIERHFTLFYSEEELNKLKEINLEPATVYFMSPKDN